MQDAEEIMEKATDEAKSYIADVRERAEVLGCWIFNHLHLVHPDYLAEIKRELRKFDAVMKKWK